MKFYYFTAVIIFKPDPHFTNAFVSFWHSFYIHCSERSQFLPYQQHFLVFKLLICTVHSAMKTLNTLRIACDIMTRDEGY